jgi:DNA protecting protein DprA
MQYTSCTEQVAIVAKILHDVNSRISICMNSNISILKHKLDGIVGDRLSQLYDPPQQLYYRGVNPSDILCRPTVAIVGSRKMSTYGRAVTEKLALELANAGIIILSGLALGVDSAAHRMAIQANTPTIAVLAGGLDSIHPTSHYDLAMKLLEKGGALVSEYPEGMPPLAHQPSFPIFFYIQPKR